MSRYADKIAKRRADAGVLAAIDLAMRITDGGTPPPELKKQRTPPPKQRGILVDLGTLPENCARAFDDAAAALDCAFAVADEMRNLAERSAQSGEAASAWGLASTTAPRCRAQAARLRRLPRPRATEAAR